MEVRHGHTPVQAQEANLCSRRIGRCADNSHVVDGTEQWDQQRSTELSQPSRNMPDANSYAYAYAYAYAYSYPHSDRRWWWRYCLREEGNVLESITRTVRSVLLLGQHVVERLQHVRRHQHVEPDPGGLGNTDCLQPR